MSRLTHGYIPRNLGGGTIWDGRLKLRNAAEALVLGAGIYIITAILGNFLPSTVTLSLRVVLIIVVCGIAAKGIGGEPLSIWIMNIINYSNTRTYATLRPPQREMEETERRTRKEKRAEKKSAKENKPSRKERLELKKTKSIDKKHERLEEKKAKEARKKAAKHEKQAAKAARKEAKKNAKKKDS